MNEMNVQQVPVDELVPADYNPRHWGDKERRDLTESIKRFGFTQPIIVNSNEKRKNIIVGGNFKHSIAQELKMETVPVFYVDLTEKQERELNLRLNKNQGAFDYDMLSDFTEEMLGDVGFSEKELDMIFDEVGDEDDFDGDKEAAAIEEPEARYGDIYELGGHRLMCGDATNLEDVNLLMDGMRADMVFTDPPYNVNYKGDGENTSNTIKNDNMTSKDFEDFLTKTFKSYKAFTKPKGGSYVCYASRTHREFENALNAAGYSVRNQIIWVKKLASMGWGDYRWKHEPILYVTQDGGAKYYGDRKQYTEWTEEMSDTELLKHVKRTISKDEKGGSTVWRMGRESKYDHPTQKPIKLVQIAIRNSSKRGDLVLDLFGGSGSTLIAADKNNRQCFTMELDPKYIDVINKRWQQHSNGIEPKRIRRIENES